MRIASAMVRPHAVNFMDQMLRTDEGLRVEEVVLPPGAPAKPVSALLPRSRDYMLVATHEDGQWVFNPADDHVVSAGAALVLMTSPQGRIQVERLLNP